MSNSNENQKNPTPQTPVSPGNAFRRLKEGNQRFVENVVSIESLISQSKRRNLTKEQRPFAIILSCSDSRAPAEILFDQGLGDLFVIRVAGNIVAPSLVGSVEFAAATFGTRLVVVMGHSECGAVSATLNSIKKGQRSDSDNIQDIIHRITPHVEGLVHADIPTHQVMHEAIRANINASVDHLKHGSRILEDLCLKGELKIIGAEYCLESGKVEFFEEIKDS